MAYASWSVVYGEQPSAAKWNILGTNDASFADGTGIGSNAIKPNQLDSTQSSSTWAWQSWIPTFTNVSGGTLNYAKYIQIGKTVHFKIKYTLGGAGVSGAIIFTTPTSISSDYVNAVDYIPGGGYFLRTGVARYTAMLVKESSTTISARTQNASASFVGVESTTSTVPFAWGSTDVISLSGTYEAA